MEERLETSRGSPEDRLQPDLDPLQSHPALQAGQNDPVSESSLLPSGEVAHANAVVRTKEVTFEDTVDRIDKVPKSEKHPLEDPGLSDLNVEDAESTHTEHYNGKQACPSLQSDKVDDSAPASGADTFEIAQPNPEVLSNSVQPDPWNSSKGTNNIRHFFLFMHTYISELNLNSRGKMQR